MKPIIDMPVLDTDTHIVEPADLWTSRISTRKWGDKVLHVKWDPRKKLDYWFIGDKAVFSAWGCANWGWKGGPMSIPPKFEDTQPACWDANARLREMDACGIRAAVLYPNLGAVLMGMYAKMGIPELMLASVQAYNDWLIDWISVAPNRFVPTACLPLWSVEETVLEIQRATKLGHKALVMSCAPHEHGWPYLGDRVWDPVWAAARDSGLPISFHAGGGDIGDSFLSPERFRIYGIEANYVRHSSVTFLDNSVQMCDLLMSGVPARYPELKFALVESGLGHVPFTLESLDYHFKIARLDKARPEFKKLPSEYFRDQVYVNYWFEKFDGFYLERLGADNIMFETDFPHTTCLGGTKVREAIRNGLNLSPVEVQEKILWRNAARLYNVDMS